MFNKALAEYKDSFVESIWPEEKYKWMAVKCFQDNWDIDSKDFPNMLKKSLALTGNLLASNNNFPAKMIQTFAEDYPNEVRNMFKMLFNENLNLCDRIDSFKETSDILLERYNKQNSRHFQSENSISTYLWLRYPDKYYIYKYSEIKSVSEKLKSDCIIKKGRYRDNIINFLSFYDDVCKELNKDSELKNLLKSQLDDTCYEDSYLKTMTIDFGFYISRNFNTSSNGNSEKNISKIDTEHIGSKISEKIDSSKNRVYEERIDFSKITDINCGYWFLNANPKIWSMSEMPVGDVQFYTLYNINGHKRRVFKNFLDAKEGDFVIGYESTPVKKIVALLRICKEQDGERIYFEKLENLSSPIDFDDFKNIPDLKNMEYLSNPQGSFFKLEKNEFELLIDLIRDENPISSSQDSKKYTKNNFLSEVFVSEEKYNQLASVLRRKKNIILQGAPGTGKTFATKRLAYSIIGEIDKERVELIQFHQNYSYEDFMMGYKPVENGFKLKDGVFYRFCKNAANYPDKDFFFIIDEINRGNISKIFGELLMLIESDYRGKKMTLAYNEMEFSVPKNVYIIGMMNTADRSLAMIDYALRRRFSFFDMEPGFETEQFKKYQDKLKNKTFDKLIDCIKNLNAEIAQDNSLGRGFCIGHSYFCNQEICTEEWMREVVEFDIIPMLKEYWFDDEDKVEHWKNILLGIFL